MKGKKKQSAPKPDALGVTYGGGANAAPVKPEGPPPKIGTREYIDYAARGDNNKSVIMGTAGYVHEKTKKLDPLYWLLGKKNYGKIQKFIGDTGPEWTNKQLAPVTRLVRKTDPMSYIAKEGTGFDQAGDWTENKSGDVMAAIAGGYFGGTAAGLWGGFGSGGSGGAAGGSATGGGFQNPYANMDWSNPQTYTQMAQQMPQQQGAQQDPQAKFQEQLAEMQRRRKAREAQERAIQLAQALQEQTYPRPV